MVTDDFNGDGHLDFAVFDAGVYVWEESSGYGNPPQLLLSTPSDRLEHSASLADAVREEHEQRPPPVPSPGPADLHIKSATSGDIDNDGDVDLWVQSGGGANVEEHLVVNNGDGTFTVDRDNRATRPVLHASRRRAHSTGAGTAGTSWISTTTATWTLRSGTFGTAGRSSWTSTTRFW